MDRESRKKRQIEVQELLESVQDRLMEIPGVQTVAVGLKYTDGKRTEDIVLRVGVAEKRPLSELSPKDVIPAEIEGIPTDVFVVRPTVTTIDSNRYRPLVGGIEIDNGSGGKGTLGCFARRNVENDVVILSNQHVMFSGKSITATNIEIAQPGFSCCCCCRSGKVGDVLAGVIGGTIDAAIASISDDVMSLQEVAEIGGIAGTDAAVVGDAVKKRGRTSGVTTGVVSMVNFATNNGEGSSFTDQIFIDPDPEFDDFQVGGDSGAALLDEDNNVVGLMWGKNGNSGVASPIADVESQLNITVFAQVTTAGAAPKVAVMPPPGSDGVVRRRDWESLLWAETASDDPLGRKISQHWNEVWDLIQTNREVGLRWQRGQGPAFAAAFERTTRVTRYRVPEEVDGVSFTQLLLAMATALEQHGSPELKADIREFGIGLIPALQGCRTADELWRSYHNIKAAQAARARNAG